MKLNYKLKLSKRLWLFYEVGMVVFLGLICVFVLGVLGYWKALAWDVLVIFLSGIVLYTGYGSISKIAVKRLFAFLLICGLVTVPLFTISTVMSNQSTAQNLTTSKEVKYFKNLLDGSYNYTELIVWEQQHLNFTNGALQRNDDPIEIYEYGIGRCQEFAILYADLCISQGYRCRIVENVFNDHAFNEVLETNGTWIRIDASLGKNDSRAIGYPMFFEKEKGWGAPIMSLAFENSSITDVTHTYRSDGISLLSPLSISVLIIFFLIFVVAIVKLLVISSNDTKKDKQRTKNECNDKKNKRKS
jgi:hypothetical protein